MKYINIDPVWDAVLDSVQLSIWRSLRDQIMDFLGKTMFNAQTN